MTRPAALFFALFFALLFALLPATSAAKIIHREHSLYRNILVTEEGPLRCLVFTIRGDSHGQSCIDLTQQKRLVFAYVRMTMGGLLLDLHPRRILVIGLGGGSIPMTFAALFPDAHIDVVELDPAVLRVAKRYFRFRETPNMKVAISDGRVFVKRAQLAGNHYDFIVLDAFTGDYIPEHLMTTEFLTEVKSILTEDGVLVANTFSTSALYDYESQTYKAVYGKFFNFKMPNTGNRLIIARNGPLPDDATLRRHARSIEPLLVPYGVHVSTFIPDMLRGEDWDHTRRPLTDQYSPANLLRQQAR